MKQVTASGKTVEEAINTALELLQAPREQAEWTIIDEGRTGFLGLFGSKPAVVQAVRKPDPVEQAEAYLRKILAEMGIDAEIDTVVKSRHVLYSLQSDKAAILIGKRGRTLNALQYLVQLALNQFGKKPQEAVVDVNGYRQKRKESLQLHAGRMAERAIRTGGRINLEPMPAFERKIIHAALQRHSGVTTSSEGKEPYRYVVIEAN